MWLWILIGLNIITKVHGFSNGKFPQSCESMLPHHTIRGTPIKPQNTEPPFEIVFEHGNEVDPITGTETIGALFLEACLSLSTFVAVVIH